jgi:hypothetical protein
MASEDWPLCSHCGDRLGVYELLLAIDGEGELFAVAAGEVFADPGRYRTRVLHEACALDVFG